uniref:Uncharacterized protein n=1 Tax=Steinernema glaseri TaxID=37863 RepID=A0A1I7Z9W2_9BILA
MAQEREEAGAGLHHGQGPAIRRASAQARRRSGPIRRTGGPLRTAAPGSQPRERVLPLRPEPRRRDELAPREGRHLCEHAAEPAHRLNAADLEALQSARVGDAGPLGALQADHHLRREDHASCGVARGCPAPHLRAPVPLGATQEAGRRSRTLAH